MSTSFHSSPSIYIISPHQDDAAFSLSLTIAKLAKRGLRITVVNCFTRSRYHPLGMPESIEAVSKIRHNEDERFAKSISGLRLHDLGCDDAPIRLGISSENVCQSRESSPLLLLDPARGKLKQKFLDLADVDLIFIPLAVGGHVDHLLARNEALAAFRGKPIVLYQDLPYAGRFSEPDFEIGAICRELGLRCEPFRIAGDDCFEEKLRYISAYSSQASEADLKAIASYAGGERLWVTQEAWPLLPALTRNAARWL